MSSYKALQKKSGQERILFGKRLLEARAKERNTTVEAQATQLKNTSGKRKLAQRAKQLTGKQRGAPLRPVNAPTGNSHINRVECTDKLSIEQAFACEGTQTFLPDQWHPSHAEGFCTTSWLPSGASRSRRNIEWHLCSRTWDGPICVTILI
jgi:hypothetical protein